MVAAFYRQQVSFLSTCVFLRVLVKKVFVQDTGLHHIFIVPREDFLSLRVNGCQLYHVGIRPRQIKSESLAGGHVGRWKFTFLQHLHILLAISGHLQKLITELAVLQVGEIVAVLNGGLS